MRVEVGERERLDLAESLRTQILDNVECDPIVDDVLGPLSQRGQERADAHDNEDADQSVKADRAFADDLVDRTSLQDRQVEREGADKRGKDDRENNKTDVTVNVAEDLAEDLALAAGFGLLRH